MNKLKCYLILSLVIIMAGLLEAEIHSLPGSGLPVFQNQNRDYTFKYHSQSDDLHLYGSSKWAVRFNFGAVYPSYPTSLFEIRKALVYFPEIADSARIELFTDANGQPGQRLTLSEQTEISLHDMEFAFPDSLQLEIAWLVVSYQTSFNSPIYPDRLMSASRGGGSHSYYLTNGYYQSLSDAGFNCELLIGVSGRFVTGGEDLVLTSFDLDGSITPGRDVRPYFSIFNNSDREVTDAEINLLITKASGDTLHNSPISIREPIYPQSEFVVTPTTPGFEEYVITLPDVPMQLRMKAVLSSQSVVGDTLNNNTVFKTKNSFRESYGSFITENFLLQSHTSLIGGYQDQVNPENFVSLFYYPILSDSLGNLQSQRRYNWYGYNSLPRAVVNGNKLLVGYNAATYQSDFLSMVSSAINSKSFISNVECRADTSAGMGSVELTFRNGDTYLFTSSEYTPATAEDTPLMTSSRLFVGLFKKIPFEGENRLVLDRWIAFADTINNPLTINTSANKRYTFSLFGTETDSLSSKYTIAYWIQQNTSLSGQILYSGLLNFNSQVSVEDELLPQPGWMLYPNPLKYQEDLKLSLSSKQAISPQTISIYNLKGQRIATHKLPIQHTKDLFFTLKNSSFPASGIYFVRFDYIDQAGKSHHQTSKITYLR